MCSIRLHKDFTKASARESDIGREGERTVWDRCSLTKSKQCWVGVGISIEYCTATVTELYSIYGYRSRALVQSLSSLSLHRRRQATRGASAEM